MASIQHTSAAICGHVADGASGLARDAHNLSAPEAHNTSVRVTRRNLRKCLVGSLAAILATSSVPTATAAEADLRIVGGMCANVSRGLPVYGVRYLPHLVGEPYPHPESKPQSLYSPEFQDIHARDLPLIGEHLAANALTLAPWPTDRADKQHTGFFSEMANSGLCKVIPTFHLAKYHADMLRADLRAPRTDSHSAIAVDFMRFGGSVDSRAMGDVEVVAWTVDMSLDLERLLPLVGDRCEFSRMTQDTTFTNYMRLMDALQHWVHPTQAGARSAAQALRQVPLLIPLDLSRVSWTEPAFHTKLRKFLQCMSTSYEEGGWSTLFAQNGQENVTKTRWLLSFALPTQDQAVAYNFHEQLNEVAEELSERGLRAIIMVGSQALEMGATAPINSATMQEDYNLANARYKDPLDDYTRVMEQYGNLDGFMYDEWVDDWDRSTRGPFYLATETLEEMQEECPNGGRYSHDIENCHRRVGSAGRIFPEFFGLAAASSQLLRHCVRPRFSKTLFSEYTNKTYMNERVEMQCAFVRPSSAWVGGSLILLAVVATIQVSRMCVRWARCPCRRRHGEEREPIAKSPRVEAPKELRVGYVKLTPPEERLCGGHSIELQSNRLRSNEEAGWWLWQHVATQMTILHQQVQSEVLARSALRARSEFRPPPKSKSFFGATSGESIPAPPTLDLKSEEESDDLARAMQTVHRRVLEGFASWCTYVADAPLGMCCPGPQPPGELRRMAEQVENNRDRSPARLFAEALVLRVMESMGEHILACPERLSFLLYGIMKEAGGLEETGPIAFSIDLEKLQDGLPQMKEHSNPYVRKKMSTTGRWELGLNFDDINDCGIQCRNGLTKTFKEPSSVMVVVDFFISYRVPIMLKIYTLAIAGYIYLGSGRGDDITTSHNGDLWNPKWLRVNYLQYTALMDASVWVVIEVLLVAYVSWQRFPSLNKRSPGIPGLKWFFEHIFNAVVSLGGFVWVYRLSNFQRKPWECAQSDVGDCEDTRTLADLQFALYYWACRAFLFIAMNTKKVPIFLYGTPESKDRNLAGRGRLDRWKQAFRVHVAWILMLVACIVVEVVLLLPTMRGLDWTTTCGFDLLGSMPGLPAQEKQCSQGFNMLSFGCVSCVSSVTLGWSLVFLGSMVDLYFIFYFSSALVGSVMGHRRHLNDLKNTTLPVDLRPHVGREAKLFEATFGPGWQQVWRKMVKGLEEESLISPSQASGLIQAAGAPLHEGAMFTSRERKLKQIHLTRYPRLAAERLAFFFQSLKWVDGNHNSHTLSTDTLTGEHFDVGTVPSLTQIIPAYNEVVIPSREFLKAGAEIEDATNGSPDDQPGLGDLTVPPRGDGMNTNLAFMISQFPDEWVFLCKRLHAQGWIETAETKELYHGFLKNKVPDEVMVEVRIWAALRSQSVAKTVIGALQYGRALASLPKMKEYYKQFPEKRVTEDHVEVILAHQTFGQKEGTRENDEAVKLILERYADDNLILVFDMNEGTLPEIRGMVHHFVAQRGCPEGSSFDYASVKCIWDKARNNIRITEVLPRKFPLRLGKGEFKTQGKACNQLNGLRFAKGHFVQALDCNMGTFIGEGFKVPYVLRCFMPLDKDERVAPRCRYLGFREYIFTGREGTVGKCHAAAEWTFGTIYQRFLSGMGMRMHYGHPDFLDGFWARNRGGMSKCSPVVNLSEDIFAGYNVHMRSEASLHIDALEFEKGREAAFNAASNFFSKISGGSIAVMRSRDNHLLCERIGILHSLSFYFASVAFYVSNLMVDMSIYLYVLLFVFFNLAGFGPGLLTALGSTFHSEWIISMGLVSLFPQVCEMILEFGAVHAIYEAVSSIFAATFFFIFQNKNVASSMREGAVSGIARYFFTGRPLANQHQTWKDVYITYWKSHYTPAIGLASLYLVYSVLAFQNRGEGVLPMVLVMISIIAWIITPIVFSPLPRWALIGQDLREFNSFITGSAGTQDSELPEVVVRGRMGTVRTLYECGLADEIQQWSTQPFLKLFSDLLLRIVVGAYVAAAVPSEILDFFWIFPVVLSLSWVVVLGYFMAGLNNVFLVLSFLVWIVALPFAHVVVGARLTEPNVFVRLPEIIIALLAFLYVLGLVKHFVLLICRLFFSRGGEDEKTARRLHECARLCFVYFFVHQIHVIQAYMILLANAATSVMLLILDTAFCGAHTRWLLNNELARVNPGEKYMEKEKTFFEMDVHRHHGSVGSSDIWFSDSDSDVSPIRSEMGGTSRTRV